VDAIRGLLEAWQGFHVEPEEYRELDTERVVVVARHHGRAKHSELELGQLESKGAAVFEVRNGKVAREVVYYDRERALADLGLAPEGDTA
jgi:hypothetical protein